MGRIRAGSAELVLTGCAGRRKQDDEPNSADTGNQGDPVPPAGLVDVMQSADRNADVRDDQGQEDDYQQVDLPAKFA